MTKRNVTVAAALICLLAILFLLAHWLVIVPNQSSYRAFRKQPTVAPYTGLYYDFLSPSPFEGGVMWVHTRSTNFYHCYLYDIDQHLIRGELRNAEPIFFNRKHDKILCYNRAVPTRSTREKVTTTIEKLTFNKIHFVHPNADVETFCVVDLKNNSCTMIGEFSQLQGAGSGFNPSPDFRYGFNKPTTTHNKLDLFICDLEDPALVMHMVAGDPVGWWDTQQILILDSSNNFSLYNVETRKTKTFLENQAIGKFLRDAGVDVGSSRTSAFFEWNGKENQFFLTDTYKRWQAVESFLIKVERPDAKLTLLNPKFKFEWCDHFDSSLKYYVYSGRESGQTNDAVYLRDFTTGTNHTLVPTIFAKEFSLPNFYKDTIIYTRSNMLWQTDFTGTKTTRLFPPPQ